MDAVAVDGADLGGGAVVDPLVIEAAVDVQEDSVAGGVAAFFRTPSGPGQLGPGDPPEGAELAADPVGQVLAVDVGHCQHRHRRGAVIADVDHGNGGELVPGLLGRRRGVFPASPGSGRLAGGELTAPVGGQCLLFVGIVLAAVDRQLGGGDLVVVGEAGKLGGQPAGSDRPTLVLIAEAPQCCARRGSHRREHGGGVAGRDLRHLVEHHHRTLRQGRAVQTPPEWSRLSGVPRMASRRTTGSRPFTPASGP